MTKPVDGAAVAAIVRRFMREFEIPGLALAIVTPRDVLIQPHGVRALGEPAPVDGETVFAIASNTKAFLSACLAMLVDDGLLDWDDPVVRHLPQFRMADPAVTAMMTVRDLLVHRSGLPLGAGDLMQFPCTDHTADEVLSALRHFNTAAGFRAGYAYDNTLYLVAGMVLERVTGLSWDDFVEQRIFAPLGMAGGVSHPSRIRTANRAARHVRLGPPAIGMGRLEVIAANDSPLIGPAGGIALNCAAIVPWLQVQLARGAMPDGARLWSEARAHEMWTPHTIVASGPGPTPDMPQRSVMQGYALGWGVSDYRGRRVLGHGGVLPGQSSRTTLLPDDGIAFTILSNSGDAEAIAGLRYELLDHLLGAPGFDWVRSTRAAIAASEHQVLSLVGNGDFAVPRGAPTLPMDRYVGRYRDSWYGDLIISRKGSGLAVNFTRTPCFKGALEIFGQDCFRTRFARGAGEDAVLQFEVRGDAVAGITLRSLSPIADLSFDFHDLAFAPVRDETPASR